MFAIREEIDRVVSLTLHHYQRIDVWINNAGHGLMDSVADVDMAACRETFDTNFFGTVACMQAALCGDEAARLRDDHQYFKRSRSYSASISCRLQRHQIRYERLWQSGAHRT